MTRGLAGWILVGLLVASATTWIVDHYAARTVDRAERDRLRQQTALLASWVAAEGESIDPQRVATEAAQSLLARVTLIGPAGVVLGDSSQSDGGVNLMDNHSDRPEIAAARSGVVGESLRRSSTTNVIYLYSARRVESGHPIAYVRIAVGTPGKSGAFRPSPFAVFGAASLLAVLLLSLGYAGYRNLSISAERLADRLSARDLDAAHFSRHRAFNRLALAIRRADQINRQRLDEAVASHRALAAAVTGMREGLLLIDQNRRIGLVNAAARELLDIDFDPVGGFVSQVVRYPSLLDAVEHTLGGERTDDVAVLSHEARGRTFEVRVTALHDAEDGPPQGALVLFLDVSRLRALEQVRQDFVANVSHELRTPLTAIKAAVEAILEDERYRDERFARMIERNAITIEELVEDLTDLSLIETGAVTLDRVALDLRAVTHEAVEQLRPVAGDLPIDIRIDEPLSMVGDRKRLRQVVINLLDNAIKFNRPGGTVEVTGKRDGDFVVLGIRDEGTGIPVGDLEKVFHRFHQVARDRSRERPGFGLGLAIVKHLVRLHAGEVSVDSELGRGSTFTLRLPAGGSPFEPSA